MKSNKLIFGFVMCAVIFCFAAATKTDGQIKKKLYSIEVPGYMYDMEDLNNESDLQMGYVKKRNNVVEELYVIVLFETKKEIKSYDLGYDFTPRTYWDLAVESISTGIDDYIIETPNPKTETVNGNGRVISDMKGKLGDVEVAYKLGVYEGKKAFYQVLTWTLVDQKAMFESDMNAILNSFKGK